MCARTKKSRLLPKRHSMPGRPVSPPLSNIRSFGSRHAVIFGVGPHVGSACEPVRHVEEGRNCAKVPDIAIRKAELAQHIAVGILDFVWCFGELDGEIEHRFLFGSEAGSAIIVLDRVAERWIVGPVADSGAMGRQAIM